MRSQHGWVAQVERSWSVRWRLRGWLRGRLRGRLGAGLAEHTGNYSIWRRRARTGDTAAPRRLDESIARQDRPRFFLRLPFVTMFAFTLVLSGLIGSAMLWSSLWFVFMCFIRWLKSDEMYSHWLLGHTRRMRPWLCLWGWLGLAGLASCDVASPCHNSIMWTYLHINKLGYKTVHMRQGEAAKRAQRGNQGYTTALHLDVEVFFSQVNGSASHWNYFTELQVHWIWMHWTRNYCIAVTLISSHCSGRIGPKGPSWIPIHIPHRHTCQLIYSVQLSLYCKMHTSALYNKHKCTSQCAQWNSFEWAG